MNHFGVCLCFGREIGDRYTSGPLFLLAHFPLLPLFSLRCSALGYVVEEKKEEKRKRRRRKREKFRFVLIRPELCVYTLTACTRETGGAGRAHAGHSAQR
jgi:hypothetical protein